MDSTQFIILSVATLLGGIMGSFGINQAVQRTRLRRLIEGWRWWGVGLYYLVVVVSVFGGLAWMIRSAIASTAQPEALGSPSLFFTFGFLVGLPFTLPTVTSIWRRIHGKNAKKPRTKPATRQERLEFAKDLERQLKEFVEDSRPVHLELQGAEGEILVFGGKFTREEGERLVAALRADLMDLDVKRVEGGAPGNSWWVRVEPTTTPTKKRKGASRRK